jgi:hypothetical protein
MDEEFESDIDSDFGLDHNAIKHLIGDIAENMDGNDGSPLTDFKQKVQSKKQIKNKIYHSR